MKLNSSSLFYYHHRHHFIIIIITLSCLRCHVISFRCRICRRIEQTHSNGNVRYERSYATCPQKIGGHKTWTFRKKTLLYLGFDHFDWTPFFGFQDVRMHFSIEDTVSCKQGLSCCLSFSLSLFLSVTTIHQQNAVMSISIQYRFFVVQYCCYCYLLFLPTKDLCCYLHVGE